VFVAYLLLVGAQINAQILDNGRAVSWMGKNPMEQENVRRGAAVFEQSCSFCHGKKADGGPEAPNLIRSMLVRHDKNGELISPVIEEGRPDRGMPALHLPASQAADVVAYLHALLSLSDSAGDSGPDSSYSLQVLLTGNAEKGKTFFTAKCAACHSATGDLAHIAAKYPAINLQARFLYPDGILPVASVTLPSGLVVTGTLKHQDTFSVSIVDAEGWYHSWPTAEVKVHIKDPLSGHRQLITQYTNDDLHNVFTYLESLK
jgi:cytochrome c oxidase cbb3-type subunit III